MKKIKITYTVPNFENFLKQFDKEKEEAIKKRMRDYADEVYPLPFTHACKEVGDFAQKILLPDFEVVIIFDKFDNEWVLIEGYSYYPRVG